MCAPSAQKNSEQSCRHLGFTAFGRFQCESAVHTDCLSRRGRLPAVSAEGCTVVRCKAAASAHDGTVSEFVSAISAKHICFSPCPPGLPGFFRLYYTICPGGLSTVGLRYWWFQFRWGLSPPSPARPDLAQIICPHSPRPPFPPGKGEPSSLFCRGFAPGAPALRRKRHGIPGGKRYRKGGLPPAAYLCPAPGGEDHLKRRRRFSNGWFHLPPVPPLSLAAPFPVESGKLLAKRGGHTPRYPGRQRKPVPLPA